MSSLNKRVADLVREGIANGENASPENVGEAILEAMKPIYQALLCDLAAVMHRYGIYWHVSGPFLPDDVVAKGFEIGCDENGVRFDSNGQLSQYRSSWPLLQVSAPSAHQKNEQAALRQSILAKAEGRAA